VALAEVNRAPADLGSSASPEEQGVYVGALDGTLEGTLNGTDALGDFARRMLPPRL
jgi:hypothetical protein